MFKPFKFSLFSNLILNKFNRYEFSTKISSIEYLKLYLPLKEEDIEEKFILGNGKGGQKINKTSSMVQLIHKPTGINVYTQKTRSRQQNRKIARSLLIEKIIQKFDYSSSKSAKKQQLISKRKARSRRKTRQKYGHNSNSNSNSDTDNGTLEKID